MIATITIFSMMLLSAHAGSHYGKGTAYSGPFDMNATGENMCEFNPKDLPERWQIYYGAMNEADWNKAGGKDICGRCIAVKGIKGEVAGGHDIKTVIVKIVDQCPDWACNAGSVDFSTTALKAITGYGWDKKAISWSFVDCPSDGGAKKGRGRGRNGRKLMELTN